MVTVGLLALVFAAVGWGVWVITPLLVSLGLQRAEERMTREPGAAEDPLYRFTTPQRLLQACWSAALLAGGGTAALLIAAGQLNLLVLAPAMAAVSAVAYALPRLWLKRRLSRRRAAFESRVVDLTMGLSNGLRSGAALPQSLEMVTRDLGGVMGEEFAVLLREYRLGVDLPEGLGRLCRRMPSEDMQLLATAVRVTLQSGGSLAEVLDKITSTIRERIEFKERLRTMTTQGRFEAIAMSLAPLVAFLILYTIDSELMRPMLTTGPGLLMLGIMGALELVGFLCINRIVNVEV
jgi:tight adherence protein B